MDLLLIVLIIALPALAQLYISLTYKKYSKVNNNNSLTGYDIAKKILSVNNLENIDIKEVYGNLSDNYDPGKKVVNLSSDIYHNYSISSAAVAAHECGHAMQDKEGYFFLKLRSLIFPIVRIATSISYWIIVIGFLLQILNLVYIGIGFTIFGLVFQIITLPVEFDASKRALKMLKQYQLLSESELSDAKSVLTAAALTYVAGTLASAIQILRLVLIATRDN